MSRAASVVTLPSAVFVERLFACLTGQPRRNAADPETSGEFTGATWFRELVAMYAHARLFFTTARIFSRPVLAFSSAVFCQ